ncbi:uncharacterized protein LOC110455772 [Mizuhopecten yessoensis]|uniref:uncharacterized protein LOC110455772 n=1 Tax=Mizuhopecten yessoensis TaxID=6573 RepID=UPI000B45AFE3|nr:uncharacterized protein LOC110455772 [Mizuhopecten yessoensis]
MHATTPQARALAGRGRLLAPPGVGGRGQRRLLFSSRLPLRLPLRQNVGNLPSAVVVPIGVEAKPNFPEVGRVPSSSLPLLTPCPLSVAAGGSVDVVWEGLDWPLPDLPVGGRLSHFVPQWKEITSDSWALGGVSKGLCIPHLRDPPLAREPIFFPSPSDPGKVEALRSEVQAMIAKGAIEELSPDQWSPGFYSWVFLVKKKSGAWRPSIDLSTFNTYVDSPHFRMETPRRIIASVRPGMWATSIDLKDAYFHIPVRRSARKFLRFTFEQKVYQFRAMPFGLTTAPLDFHQVVVGSSGATPQSRGRCTHLLRRLPVAPSGSSYPVPEHEVGSGRSVPPRVHRLQGEVGGSPLPRFCFPRLSVQNRTGFVLPPVSKFEKASLLVSVLVGVERIQVRWFLRFFGYLNSLADVVSLGRLHIRPLQLFLLSVWSPASRQWDVYTPLPESVKESARWWTLESNVLAGVPLVRASPAMTFYTDASMTGCGAYLSGQTSAGGWSGEQLSEHINVLEMRAVLLALRGLRPSLQGKAICLATDNSTVVAYLQRQGAPVPRLCVLYPPRSCCCVRRSVSISR